MTVPPVARQDVVRWRWCTMGNVILQKEGFAKQMIMLGHCVAGVTKQLPLNHALICSPSPFLADTTRARASPHTGCAFAWTSPPDGAP